MGLKSPSDQEVRNANIMPKAADVSKDFDGAAARNFEEIITKMGNLIKNAYTNENSVLTCAEIYVGGRTIEQLIFDGKQKYKDYFNLKQMSPSQTAYDYAMNKIGIIGVSEYYVFCNNSTDSSGYWILKVKKGNESAEVIGSQFTATVTVSLKTGVFSGLGGQTKVSRLYL